MGVLDFLFEGSPPPSTTTYGTTVENMPQWLSDYTQALIARANMVAGEGYQAYQGPRVAGFTDDQTNAFDVIRNNIGNWNDEFDASKTATGGALTQSMPFFNQAAQTMPGQIDQYMDPYVGNVIDRAKLEANRNWEENIMPGIESRFITSGQSGSSGHRVGLERAGRDVSEGLHSQSLAALSDAYKTAGSQYQTDAQRLAGIGQNVGQLGLQTGSQMAGLAQLQQSLSGRDASSLSMVGDARQQQNQRNLDLAYGDFREQRDYPRQNVDWMSSIIRGMPHDTTTNTTSTGPANAYQPSPLSQLISLYGLYKDVTDKAQGGVVRKARGGITHIPGPIGGYGRYAEGGKVRGALEALDKGRKAINSLTDGWLPRTRGPHLYQGPETEKEEMARAMRSRSPTDNWLPRTRGPHLHQEPETAKEEMARAMRKHKPEKKARGGLAVLEH